VVTSTALAKPLVTLTVAGLGLPFSRAEIAAEHDSDRETLAELARGGALITDDATLATADATLSEIVRLKDELIARRQAAVTPTKKLIAEVESWFRPYVKDAEAAEAGLKRSIGAFRLAKADAERRELAAARAAADEGRSNDALAHVQASQAIAAPDGARTQTRFGWEVKRIAPDLLPDEWWIPDAARIAAVAKDAGASEEPPVIPGVVFERVAIVAARR
jgi:hypothetical protein